MSVVEASAPAGGRVDIRLSKSGDDVVIAVRDTGIGFGAGLAGHLFQRFHQGDNTPTRPYGGLGLGLEIVRHLVELDGGIVTGWSAGENAGSLFRVRLRDGGGRATGNPGAASGRTPPFSDFRGPLSRQQAYT